MSGVTTPTTTWFWGNTDGDNVVWGNEADDNVVWGNAEGIDNVVWGNTSGDNVVWGNSNDENITWGSSADDAAEFGDDTAEIDAFDPSVWEDLFDVPPVTTPPSPSGNPGGVQ